MNEKVVCRHHRDVLRIAAVLERWTWKSRVAISSEEQFEDAAPFSFPRSLAHSVPELAGIMDWPKKQITANDGRGGVLARTAS